MILGLEDIAGGATILGFLIWLAFTGLFYLVNYMAVLNVLDDLTKQSIMKIPACMVAALPSACLIAIFNYNPLVLFLLMCFSNYFRVRDLAKKNPERFEGKPINKPLFYTASYLYITLVYGVAAILQQPVEIEGMMKPYWKSWFVEVPH